jgi:hypothetical protein
MSTYITTDQASGIRPLADAELNEVNGGNPAVVAGAILIGAALGYSITELVRGGRLSYGIKAGAYDALMGM